MLVDQFLQDLIRQHIIPGRRVIKQLSDAKQIAGCLSSREHMERVFQVERLPTSFSTRAFLRMNLDLIGEAALTQTLTKELAKKFTYVPTSTFHAMSSLLTETPTRYLLKVQSKQ